MGDADSSIRRAYKVRYPVIGWAKRVTYVVGPDRKIRSVYRSELRAESHPGQACQVVAPGT